MSRCRRIRMSVLNSVLTARHVTHFIVYLLVLLTFCEYIIYYVVLLQCSWPQIKTAVSNEMPPLKVAFIADTHLLGSRNGHWFDKLRREWQMHRSYQTMLSIHSPHIVFFLGDLFDEGLWAGDQEFQSYVKRFHSLFSTPDSTKVYVVVGNHDIGFHYSINRKLHQRFVDAFDAAPVSLLNVEGNLFVLINSMAMEGDGCFLCKAAEKSLKQIARSLKCSQGNNRTGGCEGVEKLVSKNTRPLLLQHFPMYRVSDAVCEGPDAASSDELERRQKFREKWECLSKESSEMLLNLLDPRLIFGGHTHHSCLVSHKPDIAEFTVASFSWRNRNNPSFLLVTLTPSDHSVSKCFLPKESTVISLYMAGILFFVAWTIFVKWRSWACHNKYR